MGLAQKRLRGPAEVRLALVRRYRLQLEGLCRADSGRTQHRLDRDSLLGHGYRRFCAKEGIYRRTLCAMVPVQRFLSAVPQPRTHLEAASALGVEYRRVR